MQKKKKSGQLRMMTGQYLINHMFNFTSRLKVHSKANQHVSRLLTLATYEWVVGQCENVKCRIKYGEEA